MASSEPPERPSTDDEVEALARSVLDNPQRARQLSELDPFEKLRHRAQGLDIELRKRYAEWVLYGVAAQLLIADLAFFLYAGLGVHWRIATAAIDVWLGATIVQVVGIVGIVTRYLFPRGE